MRSAAVFGLACIAIAPDALSQTTKVFSETTTLSTNGIWRTLGAEDGTVKGCAVQAGVSGGKFTIGGVTDRQGVLTLSLSKSTWNIPNLPVPIVLTFADGEVIRLSGSGVGTRIAADVPPDTVKPLIHYFTAESSAILTLPEGRESPWHLDLHGTTPATLAMAQCIDAANLVLPAPFRRPITPVQPSPPDDLETAAPSTKGTQAHDQVSGPDAPTSPERAVVPALPDTAIGHSGIGENGQAESIVPAPPETSPATSPRSKATVLAWTSLLPR